MAIVSDGQVIKVLRQYNPWWRNPLAIKEENKPQKRLAYKHETHTPILRVPAIAFLYLLGKAEADGQNGKM